MKLYMFPIAPNPTKVRLFIAEKQAAGCQIDIEEVVVNLPKGEQKADAIRSLNPFARLPILEVSDGNAICESLAIIDYLEECHPEHSLWGDSPLARAQAREAERIADLGCLLSVAREIHATKSPLGLPANPTVAEYHRAAGKTSFAYLESLLSDGRPLILGDRVSVADCTLAAALQFARFAETSFINDYPNI